MTHISIAIGFMSDPLKEQLARQGLCCGDKFIESIEKIIDGVMRGKINGFITDSESDRIYNRIVKQIGKRARLKE